MDDILSYAPLFGIALLVGVSIQLNRVEKQNEGLYNMLRELLDK